MKIGVPSEIKVYEYRVGLTPSHASAYINAGHEVYVQDSCGIGSGFSNDEYLSVGCMVLGSAKEIYDIADMIIKVKEPLPMEYDLMRENQIVYTYFHLAASKELTEVCLKKKIIAVAYETILDYKNELPCLKPMSEIAGRMSVIEGAKFLQKTYGGRGVLLGGATGVMPATVLVIGAGGIVGKNAVAMAVGLHANVIAIDSNIDRLTELDNLYKGRINTVYSTDAAIKEHISNADLVVGAVLIPGDKAPKLIKKSYLPLMKKGSVIVDVAIDQGGACETSVVTYHDKPTYIIDGVVHYCVGNMPGAVGYTSTMALNNSTLRYGLKIASLGVENALLADVGLLSGLNCYKGELTCKPVALAFGLSYTSAFDLLK